MAWAEKLKTGYRGRYRNPANPDEKVKVVQPDGTLFPRKRDAVAAAEEELAKARRSARARRNGATQQASITWGEWWDQLAASREFYSDTARVENNLVENHIRPQWGEVPLNQIKRTEVQTWIDEGGLRVRPNMSAATVRRIYGVFQMSINKALDKHVLDASPCAGVKLPKVPRKQKQYLELEAAKQAKLHPKYAAAVEFGLETGLRPGELAGLHASMVFPDEGYMVVQHAFVDRQRKIRDWPKDGDARSVPLTPRAVELLREALEGRPLGGGCGVPHFEGRCASVLVWRGPRGAVIRPCNLLIAMRRAMDTAQVPARTPYSIRRGFGTRAARGGADAFELADWMGHSDPRLTREYVQQSPDALSRLTAALSPSPVVHGAEHGADSRPQPSRDIT